MRRFLLWTAAGFFLTMGARACSLPRAGLGVNWSVSVYPANVCPGEMVSVAWNTDPPETACRTTCTREGCGEGCSRPVHLNISSNPAVMEEYDTYEAEHALSAGPIVRDTLFTFELLYRGRTRETRERAVHVVLPEAETTVRVPVEASCAGDRPVFATVDLDWPTFRSMMVRVVRICNPSTPSLQLQVSFGGYGTESFVLYRGDCTPDFDELRGFAAKSATITDLFTTRTVECTTRSEPAVGRELDVALACIPETDAGAPPGPEPTAAGAEIGEGPTATPTVPSSEEAGGRMTIDGNCRAGPATAYDGLDVFEAGDEVRILAQSASTPKWWWATHVVSGKTCWLSDAVLETFGPVDAVPVRAAPPLPTSTPTAVQGCLYQGPNDMQPYCYAPCPVPLDQTQGACTP